MNETKTFEVIASENESMHGCAPLGNVVAKFSEQTDAEQFARDHAAHVRMYGPAKTKFVIVACDGQALLEEVVS